MTDREELFLRASSLPLAFKCAGAVRLPLLRVDTRNDAAAVGTAVHEAMRPLVEYGSVNWDNVPQIAARYGADEDEVRMLVGAGVKLWQSVKASFPDAVTEEHLEMRAHGVHLSGHVDGISITGNAARILDFKTGRKDTSYAEQLYAYAVLALYEYRDLDVTECTVTALWLRDGSIENYTLNLERANEWWQRLQSEVANWDGVYRTGPHCVHCPRSHECDAANVVARRDVAVFADQSLSPEAGLSLMKPDEIIDVYQRLAVVESYARRAREAIKNHVAKCGPIEGNGGRLAIEVEQRRELNPVKAWSVLESAGFGDEDFAAAMDLRVSRVEKIVATKAGRGRGAGAVRELRAALEAAGAVENNDVHRLTLKRA